MREKKILVGLIGNPNTGKSLIFINLTGWKVHIGNWPGKTVEKKVGWCRHRGYLLEIVDLPGVYSLSASSVDEKIARDFILEERPDVVVDVVDATNLERNLYLVLQLMELECNLVIALNKMDVARKMGYEIDWKRLEELLNVRVVPTVALTGEGMEELKDAIVEAALRPRKPAKLDYGRRAELLIREIEEVIKRDPELSSRYPTRWLAIRILERDEDVLERVRRSPVWSEIARILA